METNETIRYYDANAYEFCLDTLNVDMSFCRNKFLRLCGKGGHILDAGCGSGRDAGAFLNAGYEVTAMDASAPICQEAEAFLGQKVVHMSFENMEFNQVFDGIWACASLLHVTGKKMPDVLKRLWTALRENGVLYASFKYGEGEQIVQGRYFHYYKEDSLRELITGQYFDVKEIFVTQDARKGRQAERWVNVLAGKRTPATPQFVNYKEVKSL